MQQLQQTLFEILKYTRIELNPGEPVDIKYLLLEMGNRSLLSERDIKEILKGVS